jgi:hypothetical protein
VSANVEYFRVLAHHQFAVMYGNVPLFMLLAVRLAVKMEQLRSNASHGSQSHSGECAMVLKFYNA